MFNLSSLIRKYKVILVDIDDTLINYTLAHKIALDRVMERFVFSIEDYNKAKQHIKMRNLRANHHKKELYFKILCENKGIHFSKAYEMFELYTSVFMENLKADQSMYHLLLLLKKANIKIVAVTNFYFLEQVNKLKQVGFLNMIDYLVCSEELEIEKPSASVFDVIMDLLKVPSLKKEDFLMIGDSISDWLFSVGLKIDYYPYNCSKMLISISGKSGSGKTTIGKIIQKISNGFIICGDGYHKYGRGHPEWERITHYNPEANNLVQLSLDIKNIYQSIGESVCVPVYDHVLGTIQTGEKKYIEDLRVVIIEGLHTLYREVIGDFIKIKIFIDSDIADKQKLERDTKLRNQKYSDVVNIIKQREQDYKQYILQQRQEANFLITVKDGKFQIELKDILLVDYLKKKYVGEYKDLAETVRNIFRTIFQNRWVSNDNK
ncbi:HAD hydrolase-like protein [Helicobacter winghamensis]